MTENTVRTWMTPTPITIGPKETIISAYEKMMHHHIRRLPVVNRERLVGIITIGDIRRIIAVDAGLAFEHDDMLTHRQIVTVMTTDLITIAPGENVAEAARSMMKNKIGGLPVVENGKLVGVFSEADLFRLVIAESWHPQTTTWPAFDGQEIINSSKGESLHIRPIRPDDAEGLQTSLIKMSPETIYDRFMGFKKALADQKARYLASLDYDNHMALVVTTMNKGREDIVGVTRYHVLDGEEGAAEFAIVISDSHQRLGLGTHLMKRLMEYGQAHGIESFVGFAHEGNLRLLRFIQRCGLPIERKFKDGIWELRINLQGVPFSEADLHRTKTLV